MQRQDGRKSTELRPVKFELNYVAWPEGSVLIRMGRTHVLCNVTVENDLPPWMKASGARSGWVTAEYAMLPRATHTRTKRQEASTGARAQEIKRLIGRALRAAVDLEALGPRTLIVDCDVIQADGGTRTASITGGFVALALALKKMEEKEKFPAPLIRTPVAAVSAGVLGGQPLLDLCYSEDSAAEADANFVMNGRGELIEIQGTAEKAPFSRATFIELLNLADEGVKSLIRLQREVLESL